MQPQVLLNDPMNLDANRRGQITDSQRKAAGVVGTAIVFVILLAVPGFMGATLALLGIGLLAEGEWAGLVLLGVSAAITAPLGAYAVFRLMGVLRLRQDLNEGRIEQVDGEVRWAGHRYRAEWAGRPRWVDNTASGLGPGAYRFYFLLRSGKLLSAAALPGLTLNADQGLEAALGKVHHFDADDLTLNRQGQMSPKQKLRLYVGAAGIGVLGALIAGACAFAAWDVAIGGRDDAWMAAGVLALLAVIFGAMLALIGLPTPYHPVFNVRRFAEHASRDGYFLCITARDPRFDPVATKQFLHSLYPLEVNEVED